MRIEILGPPGSGKTSIAESLSEKLELPYISLGNITRREVELNTEIGKKMKIYLDRNIFYPPGFLLPIIKEHLGQEECINGFILDGYPKLVHEADELASILNDLGIKLDIVLILRVPIEKALERISGRLYCYNCHKHYHEVDHPPKVPGICEKCGRELKKRKDDSPEIIKERFADFEKELSEVVGQLRSVADKVIEIDATLSLEDIINRIITVLVNDKNKK